MSQQEGTTGIQGVEGRDAAIHPTVRGTAPRAKDAPSPEVNSKRFETLIPVIVSAHTITTGFLSPIFN